MDGYDKALQDFVTLLTQHQKDGIQRRHPTLDIARVYAYHRSGRKFDKVIVHNYGNNSVRYFIDKKDGTIYGARSTLAPNFKWYFGTVFSADKWDWSDFHGVPVNDESVIVAGMYAGYIHYMKR